MPTLKLRLVDFFSKLSEGNFALGLTRTNLAWLILGERKSVVICIKYLAEAKIGSGKFTKMVPYTRFNLNIS